MGCEFGMLTENTDLTTSTNTSFQIALKVWDLIFLYGAEVLFRVALAIWSQLQTAVLHTHTCDEFYGLMSTATLDIRQGLCVLECNTTRNEYS